MKIRTTDISKTRLNIANKEKCTPRELAFAELLALGWKPLDAAITLGVVTSGVDYDKALLTAETFASREQVVSARSKRVKQIKLGSYADANGRFHPTPNRGALPPKAEDVQQTTAALTDAEILDEMWNTIQALDRDNPKRAQLLETYYKTKRRQGEKDGEDTTIHFYLPRPECDTCPFKGGNVITMPTLKDIENRRSPLENDEDEEEAPIDLIDEETEEQQEPQKSKRGRPKKL